MWMWAVATALASAPDAYPLRADVALPPRGVVRLHLPPELRSADDPRDATDVLLVDGTGRPVPVLRVGGGARWADERARLDVRATADPDRFVVDLGPLPLDGLAVNLVGSAEAATVTVRRQDQVLGEPTLVWRLPGGASERVPLPGVSGPVEVVLARHRPAARQPPRFEGLRLVDPGVAPDVLVVDPGPPRMQENGWAVHELPLARPLPVTSVRLNATEPNFEREAAVLGHDWTELAGLGYAGVRPTDATTPVRRVTFGDVAAEFVAVPAPRGSERLSLLVAAHDRPPLHLETVDLVLDGVHLLVLDAGPGPHVLYAGAEPGTSPTWDLEAARAELARAPASVVEPGPASVNPAWVPPEVRANLVVPSTPLEIEGFAWSRPIEGGPGPVRVPLPPEVLAEANPELHDVRLAHDGRKVPHLVRQRAGGSRLDGVRWERTEDGARSLLRVAVPIEGVPLSAIVLSSPAPQFARLVTVQVANGAHLRTVRAVPWVGGDRPDRLAIDLDLRVGESLLVVIDNGDDPPLPIDDLELWVEGWEVVAVLPEGETRLYYGDPDRGRPDYDLALLASSLRRRTLPEGWLGQAQAVAPPALSVFDRGLLGVGLAALGIGLVGLLLEVMRRAPPTRTDYTEGASDPEAP